MMEAWDSTPRLAFLSPEPGSGKTRALEISQLLVPNGIENVNMSPAYLFRRIGADVGLPTLLVDEVDALFNGKGQSAEEIRGLLNAGHRRGAMVGRCVIQGKTITPEESPAFCAVALAGLGFLPDTLMTGALSFGCAAGRRASMSSPSDIEIIVAMGKFCRIDWRRGRRPWSRPWQPPAPSCRRA